MVCDRYYDRAVRLTDFIPKTLLGTGYSFLFSQLNFPIHIKLSPCLTVGAGVRALVRTRDPTVAEI